jgi:glycosyltransferase involved in cell wall biosynthesis
MNEGIVKFINQQLKFLFLEPFFGGSHRAFAQSLISHSKHTIDLVTLPDSFWKWRLSGAALHFYKTISDLGAYDGLITTSLMRLADFKALCGTSCPPVLVYFHESQLTYPQPSGKSMNFQLGFADITTALCADQVLFNSETHYNTFFTTLTDFIKKMPDYRPEWVTAAIRSKSGVLYPGCSFDGAPDTDAFTDSDPPLIIWNHRWEFDKNPKDFFEALETLLERGHDFQIALLGKNVQFVPKQFIKARKRFGDRIVQYGYVPSKEKYYEWLRRGTVIVSTANQENFGMSVIEAIRQGCLPLLPKRLSYPEIIPEALHSDFLYQDNQDMADKLAFIIENVSVFQEKRRQLAEAMTRFGWENLGDLYDKVLMRLVSERRLLN